MLRSIRADLLAFVVDCEFAGLPVRAAVGRFLLRLLGR